VNERTWDVIPLRELVSEAKGGFASGARDPAGIVQLRMNNVAPDGSFDWSSLTRVPADRSAIEAYKLQPGDVVFNATNSAALVGKTALFGGYREPVVFSNHFTRLRTLRNRLHPEYLAFWLQAQWRLRVFERICDRWIGQAAVQRDKLLDLAIPCPSLAEQRRIAARLSEQLAAVERARKAAAAKAEATRQLVIAVLRAAFSQYSTAAWPAKLLGDAGDIASGVALGRQLRGSATRLVPYLRVANVKDGFLDLAEVKEIEATEEEIADLKLRLGDLLLTEGGDPDKLGRGCLWDEQLPLCIHQNHIFRVRLKPAEYLPEFASLQIGSTYGKAYFLKHAKRTTGIATINRKVLGAFPLLSPPLATQHAVVRSLTTEISAARRARGAAEAELAATEALGTALLCEVFSQAT
jgi:type I restriction enzyme S subunit